MKVTRKRGFFGVELISEKSVVELHPQIARDLLDRKYEILGADNEGFESEIFFGREKVTGAFYLREGPCEGQVTVKMLYEKRQ